MTSTTLRPALWSGHEWLDRLRPEHRILTGTAYRIAKRALDLVIVLVTTPCGCRSLPCVPSPSSSTIPEHPSSSSRSGRG